MIAVVVDEAEVDVQRLVSASLVAQCTTQSAGRG